MVLHACNPSTVVQKAGISGVQSHPELYSNFEASLDYMRLSLKKKKRKREEANKELRLLSLRLYYVSV